MIKVINVPSAVTRYGDSVSGAFGDSNFRTDPVIITVNGIQIPIIQHQSDGLFLYDPLIEILEWYGMSSKTLIASSVTKLDIFEKFWDMQQFSEFVENTVTERTFVQAQNDSWKIVFSNCNDRLAFSGGFVSHKGPVFTITPELNNQPQIDVAQFRQHAEEIKQWCDTFLNGQFSVNVYGLTCTVVIRNQEESIQFKLRWMNS